MNNDIKDEFDEVESFDFGEDVEIDDEEEIDEFSMFAEELEERSIVKFGDDKWTALVKIEGIDYTKNDGQYSKAGTPFYKVVVKYKGESKKNALLFPTSPGSLNTQIKKIFTKYEKAVGNMLLIKYDGWSIYNDGKKETKFKSVLVKKLESKE